MVHRNETMVLNGIEQYYEYNSSIQQDKIARTQIYRMIYNFSRGSESTKLSGKGLKFQPIRSEKALFPGF